MRRDKKWMLVMLLSCGMSAFLGCDDAMPDYYQERDFEVGDFEGVSLGEAFQIKIEYAEEFSVTAKGEKADLDDLRLEVVNGILEGNYRVGSRNHKRTLLEISTPVLKKAVLKDATTSLITGFGGQESLQVKVSGASKLRMDSEFESVEVEVNGASEVIFLGRAGELNAEVNGASRFYAAEFLAQNVLIDLEGASEASVKAVEELRGEVNGNSLLKYSGIPENIEVEVATDSRMIRL